MMYYKLDNNGFYIGVKSTSNEGMEFYTETAPPTNKNFLKPKVENNIWIEGATAEDLLEYQRSLIPQEITRRQFKIALAVLGKNEVDILNGINQLPEPTQTIARISYMEAGTFERYNPELIAVATMFLNMNEDDIDEVFKIGSQY